MLRHRKIYHDRTVSTITIYFAALLILGFCLTITGFSKEKLLVGVKHAPPFVIVNDNKKDVTGFSIDLVKEIIREISRDITVDFHVDKDLESHLRSIQQKKVDLGITSTSINSEREKILDFSHPFFKGGPGILVRAENPGKSLWNLILSSKLLVVLGGILVYILFFAHIIWLLERGKHSFNDKWLPGIFDTVWWMVVTMSTVGYGDFVPKKAVSRGIAIFIIFSGVILFGVLVGTMSSSMTVQQLKSEISGPGDLVGRKVASVSKSTASIEMRRRGAVVLSYPTLKEAIRSLEEGQVLAVVYDMPQLQYELSLRKDDKLTIAGKIFMPEYYGISFPLKSPYRKKVNIALLRIKEGAASRYQGLYQKWFQVNPDD